MAKSFPTLRYAARSLVKRPALSIAVVAVVALGLGAVSSVLNVVHASLVRPLPFPQPDRIMAVSTEHVQRSVSQGRVSIPDFVDWQERSRSWEQLALISDESLVLSGVDPPERLAAARVSSRFFQLFGLGMLAGEVSPDAWEQPDSQVAVISEGLWKRRFGADPGILGRRLTLSDLPYTVIAVAPAELNHPRGSQVWFPLDVRDQRAGAGARGARYLLALGRLAQGVTPEAAREEMSGISEQLAQEHAKTNQGFKTNLTPLHERLIGELRTGLLVLAAAVALVLLIVCTNVAGMLLARGAARLDEVRLRFALGATRRSVAAQFLSESLLLALVGGAIGLVLGSAGSQLLVRLYPTEIPGAESAGLTVATAGLALALSILAGLLFGLIPALQTARHGAAAGSRGATGARIGMATRRTQAAILVLQLAVTLALLVGAGLTINSLAHLLSVDSGLDQSENVLTARVSLPSSRYPEASQRIHFFRQLLTRLDQTPGIASAAATTNLPMSGSNMLFRFSIEDRGQVEPDRRLRANYRAVSPDYFRTLGVPILAGREFDWTDREDAIPVAVVNQSFARRFLEGGSALDRRIKIVFGAKEVRRIVGVVGDLRHFGLEQEARPEMYVPFAQNPWSFMNLAIRADGEAGVLTPKLRTQLAAMDRDQPLEKVRSLQAYLSDSLARPRFYGFLLTAFALLALTIAVVGIYGLNAYWVRLRLGEVGVRMAVGASAPAIRRLFVGKVLRLALVGVVLGAGLSLLLSRFLSGLLFGVSATDPRTFLAMTSLLMASALLAAYLPARRAANMDPATVLRDE